jgi:hypothetical protein
MSISADIDQGGFLTNVLPSIGLENDSKALCELIDNSIDASATNINIKVSNDEIIFEEDDEIITINTPYIVVVDNGNGMDKQSLKRIVTLCNKNEKTNKNGKFGIGAMASNATFNKLLIDNNNFSRTIILSRHIKSNQVKEIIINWNTIYNNEKNTGWSSVGATNCSDTNRKLFDYYMNDSQHGVVVINTIDTSNIYNLVNKLKYNCIMYYHDIIKNNLTINYLNNLANDDNSETKWSLSKDNYIIDFTGLTNKVNNKYSFNIYYNNNTFYAEPNNDKVKKYNKKIILNSNDDTPQDNLLLELKPININNSYSGFKIVNKNDISNLDNIMKNKILLKIIITDPLQEDEKVQLYNNPNDNNSIFKIQTTEYVGLYVKRNKRILSRPCKLENIRQNNEGTRLRCVIEYSNNEHDILFPLQANKSQFDSKNIAQGLYKLISQLAVAIYKSNYLGKNDSFNTNFYKSKDNSITISDFKCKSRKQKSPTSSPNPSPNPNPTTLERKHFTQKTKEYVLTTVQNHRCPIFKTVLNSRHNPYEYDHINGKDNNDPSNCQALSISAHKLKSHDIDVYNQLKSDPSLARSYLLKTINTLLGSELLTDVSVSFSNNKFCLT